MNAGFFPPAVVARRAVAAVVVLAASLFAAELSAQVAEATSFPDRNNAFGGVPFGATIEEAKQKWQLEKIEAVSAPDDPVALYLRQEETLLLGGAVAREVVYYFLNGRFYAVGFLTPDQRQTEILREALELGYGAAPHADPAKGSLVWPGRLVSAQMTVNSGNGEGRVLFFSNELQSGYEKSLRDAAAKTAAGL